MDLHGLADQLLSASATCHSHTTPTKAMNLTHYTAAGGSLLRSRADRQNALADRTARPISCPGRDYVLTLDADSVILPEYCVTPGPRARADPNARVGVAQTPYSGLPGGGTRLERIAGATTDLQHILTRA